MPGPSHSSPAGLPLPERPDARLLQALFDHARDGVLFADDDGLLLGANPAACRMLGHDASWLFGHRLGEFVDPAKGDEPRRSRWDSFLEAGTQVGTVTLRTGDGHLRVVEYNAVARVLPGVHLSLLRDVSDRMAAERERLAALHREAETGSRLAMAVSLAGLGIARREPAGSVTEVNENFCRIVGRPPRDSAIADDEALAMVHPDDQSTYLAQRELAAAGEPVQPVELRLRHADGRWRHVLVQRVVEHRDDGSPGALVTITLDVSGNREAALAREAQRAAEQANRAKSEFLSRMSHELRTPLNAILGFSEVLQHNDRHPLADEQRVQVRHIEKAGQHLLQLIDDLLDISRIEIGTLQLRMGDVDAATEVREAVQAQQADARGRRVEIDLQLPADGQARVRADRTRLRQVVTNLLSNAIKYNRPGGRVSLTLEPHRGRWRLVVADTGIGMSAAQLGMLFQPFNRLGREAGGIKGVGIGLAITRHLVEAMDGTIVVSSEPGAGSRFEVELAPSQAALPAPPAALPPPQVRPEVRGRVLYVEDDELNRALVRDHLAWRPGVELLMASDGRSGLAMARQRRPDLLLLDLTLPDMHGLEVLGAMQSDAALRDVPCVGLSAHAMASEIERARGAGMAGYLVKPLTVQGLLAEVDRLLGSR